MNGAARAVQRIEGWLAARGCTVSVVHPANGCEDCRSGHARHFAVPSWNAPIPQLNQRIARKHSILRRVTEALTIAKPDVVHAHSPFLLGATAITWASTAGVPSVLTNHTLPENVTAGSAALRAVAPVVRSAMGRSVQKTAQQASAITAPSSFAADHLATLLGPHSGNRLQVVSNGIDTSLFTPNADARSGRRGGPLRILYVGRMQREKRVVDLLHAAFRLRSERFPFVLKLVGDGPDRNRLQRLTLKMGLGAVVEFAGRTSEYALREAYQDAQVFVMPSEVELQCLALLEALASGLPAVVANAGALPELVLEGHNGALYTPRDTAEMAAKIRGLVVGAPGSVGLTDRCRAVAHQHDRNLVVTRLVGIYEAALR